MVARVGSYSVVMAVVETVVIFRVLVTILDRAAKGSTGRFLS